MKVKEILKRGMCVEFRNEWISLYDGYDFFDISDMHLITHDSLLNDDLNDIHNKDKFDVMKIWKDYTMKELLWERKTEILDEVEKRYFEDVIRPFKRDFVYARKDYSSFEDKEGILIMLKYGHVFFPLFDKGTMYKGMKLYKKYTLKELGLFTNNYKITLKEFFSSKEECAIHCDTEEKANQLLKAFDKLGKKWNSGSSYLKDNNWCNEKENTCYSNKGLYGGTTVFKEDNDKIYEFEEVDLR